MTSRRLATAVNTMNLLAPALLALAIVLLIVARLADIPQAMRAPLNGCAAIAIGAAVGVRIAWGISIRIIRRNNPPAPRRS